MSRKYKNYTDEDIIKYSKEVFSLSALLRKLNLVPLGNNFNSIKRHLKRLDVDCSHWTGKVWNKNQQLKNWEDYNHGRSLKPHLIKVRGHRCEKCLNTHWLGHSITLELEHRDGDRCNNSLNNLQLLCPNCHSYTPTWKKRKKETLDIIPLPINYEEERQIHEIKNKSIKITTEKSQNKIQNKKSKTKGTYPENHDLLKMVWETPLAILCKTIGVTSNAITRYCKFRNIPLPPVGFWVKLKHKKFEECEKIKSDIFKNWEGFKK